MMLPGILRESYENRSYWKGHGLPEILQSERKQSSKGKGSSLCEMVVSHLINGWQQGGCIQQLYPFTSDWSESKDRRACKTCLWRISFNLSERYRTWVRDDQRHFLPVMMTPDFFNCPAVTAQVIISWITDGFKQYLLESYFAFTIFLSSRSSRLLSQITSSVNKSSGKGLWEDVRFFVC